MLHEEGVAPATAEKHLGDFREAVKFLLPSDPAGKIVVKALDFDTLTTREVLWHEMSVTESRRVEGSTPHAEPFFAVSCVFKINDATVTITLPQAHDKSACTREWDWYQRLMADWTMAHRVFRGKFEGDHWKIDPRPMQIIYGEPPNEALPDHLRDG